MKPMKRLVATRSRAACTLAPVATGGNGLDVSPRRARRAALERTSTAVSGPFGAAPSVLREGPVMRPIEAQSPRLGQAPLGATGGAQPSRQGELARRATVPLRTGRSRRLEASATATARSAAGSSMRRPPATLT